MSMKRNIFAGALTGAAIMAAPIAAQAEPVQKPYEKCQQWPQYELKRLPQDNCSDSKPADKAGTYTS